MLNTGNLWSLWSAVSTWGIKSKTIFKHNTNSKTHETFKKTLEKWFLSFFGLKFTWAIPVFQLRDPGVHWNLPFSLVETKNALFCFVFVFLKNAMPCCQSYFKHCLISILWSTSAIINSTGKRKFIQDIQNQNPDIFWCHVTESRNMP